MISGNMIASLDVSAHDDSQGFEQGVFDND